MDKTKEFYRAVFEDGKKELIVSSKRDDKLTITLKGLGKKFTFPVTSGDVSLCATVLKHHGQGIKINTILNIPDLRGRCKMLPPSLSIKGRLASLPSGKFYLKRIKGSDQKLRKIVEKIYGETK